MAFSGLRSRMKSTPDEGRTKTEKTKSKGKKAPAKRPPASKADVDVIQTFLLSKNLPIASEALTAPDSKFGKTTNESLRKFIASAPTDEKDKAIKTALSSSGLIFEKWQSTFGNLKGIATIISTGGESSKSSAAAKPENFLDFQMPAVINDAGEEIAPAREVKNFPFVAAVARKGPGIEAALRNWRIIPDSAKGSDTIPYLRTAMEAMVGVLHEQGLQGNASMVRHIVGSMIDMYQRRSKTKNELYKGIDLVRKRFDSYLWKYPRGSRIDMMISDWLESRRLTNREGYVDAPNRFRDNWPRIYSYLTRTLKLTSSTPSEKDRPEGVGKEKAKKPAKPTQPWTPKDMSHASFKNLVEISKRVGYGAAQAPDKYESYLNTGFVQAKSIGFKGTKELFARYAQKYMQEAHQKMQAQKQQVPQPAAQPAKPAQQPVKQPLPASQRPAERPFDPSQPQTHTGRSSGI